MKRGTLQNHKANYGMFLFCSLLLLSFSCVAQIPEDNLQLWLRADKGVIVKNDSIVRWLDVSGHQNDAFSTTPVQPELHPNSVNHLSSIRFDGKTCGLQTKRISTFDQKRGCLFLVMKVNGPSERSSVGTGNVLSTYHGEGSTWQICASIKKMSFYDGLSSISLDDEIDNTLDWTFISLIRRSDTSIDYYRNGRFQSCITIHNFQSDSNTLKIGYNGLQHFASDDVTETFNGEIAEIIVYNNVLDKNKLQQVHKYLSIKYAIEILPGPYYQRWWFYVIVFLVILLLVLLLYKYKQHHQLKKQMKLLQIEKAIVDERIRISRDIHDDLGAGLAKLNLLSEVLQVNIQDEELTRSSLRSISATSEQLVENMRDLVWAMNPENITLHQLLARLREYSSDYLEDFPITLIIQCTDSFQNRRISSELNRQIQMIVKEALQNIVKHASANTIHFNISVENELDIEIIDNGIGFDLNSKNIGNGLKNMKARSNMINAQIHIESQREKGTSIRFTIDLKEYPIL